MTLDHDKCLFFQKCWSLILENSSLAKKKEESVRRTKIDFFVLTKRSLLTDFSRVLVIRKIFDTWLQITSSSQISSLQILSWLQISFWLQIILRSTTFINRSLFLMRTWWLSSKIKIFVYLIWHYWVTNSKNLFIVRKDFVCVKKRVINIEYRIRCTTVFIKIFCIKSLCCHLNIDRNDIINQ
jgi:hypothetical protein